MYLCLGWCRQEKRKDKHMFFPSFDISKGRCRYWPEGPILVCIKRKTYPRVEKHSSAIKCKCTLLQSSTHPPTQTQLCNKLHMHIAMSMTPQAQAPFRVVNQSSWLVIGSTMEQNEIKVQVRHLFPYPNTFDREPKERTLMPKPDLKKTSHADKVTYCQIPKLTDKQQTLAMHTEH